MLTSFTWSIFRGLRPSLAGRQIAANFGKWNRGEIVKKLREEEDLYHRSMAADNPEFDRDFKAGGWKVKFEEDSTRFEITKETSTHQIYVSTHVKDNPPNLPEDKPSKSGQSTPNVPAAPVRASRWKKNQAENYSQVKIFIRKKGQARWLVIEMSVMDETVQIVSAFFTYLSPGPDWERHVYPGPYLQTVPQYILASINALMLEFGINTEFLVNLVLYSEQPVDRLDLKWLRNIRQMYE